MKKYTSPKTKALKGAPRVTSEKYLAYHKRLYGLRKAIVELGYKVEGKIGGNDNG